MADSRLTQCNMSVHFRRLANRPFTTYPVEKLGPPAGASEAPKCWHGEAPQIVFRGKKVQSNALSAPLVTGITARDSTARVFQQNRPTVAVRFSRFKRPIAAALSQRPYFAFFVYPACSGSSVRSRVLKSFRFTPIRRKIVGHG